MTHVKSSTKVIPFISTNNPKNPEIFTSVKNNIPILEQDERLKRIFSGFTFIKSKRQPKNLKKLLTRAKFDELPTLPKVKKCNRGICGLCTHLLEGDTFHFNCGRAFKIFQSMNCDVKNVIYVMRCCGCHQEYIGETGDFLRKRVTVHNQQIRDPKTRMLKVSAHIDSCAARHTPKYHIFPFYKMKTENSNCRKTKELFFIRTLKPQLNSSM